MQWKKLGQQLWEWRGVLVTAPTMAGLVLGLRLLGWLQPLEWAAYDRYIRSRPSELADSRIVIVAITESDLKRVGQIPVPDRYIAQTIKKIKAQEPVVIGLDLYRDLPVQPGHEELVEVYQTTPNLIGIEKKVESETSNAIAPPPELKAQNQVGVNDIVVDGDGRLRRALLFLSANGEILPNISVLLALTYLQNQGVMAQPTEDGSLKLENAVFVPFEANDGAYVRADAGGYQLLLNYRGGTETFKMISLFDVLENKMPPDIFRDRIVLIGPTATSLNDFFYTPYSSNLVTSPELMSGVEVVANITSQIISSALENRPLIQTWPDFIETLWIIAWSTLGATLSWTLRLPRRTIVIISILVGSLFITTYLIFLGGWWIPLVPALLAFLGSATLITGYIANVEYEEREMIMNLFGRHVTPQIAEAIWRDRAELLSKGRLLGRKMTATVLFTDLKNFTTVTENNDPEMLMTWLNEYMEAMAQIVLNSGGVVDKYIGDSIMAVFGVPIPRTTEEEIAQDAQQAVSCAVQMAKSLETLNQQWQSQGHPVIAMRVGIATGNVVIGSLGSSQRLDYTTIGDSVNVASRLESYDKSFDQGLCRILINQETYSYIQNQFATKLVGNVTLKGRQQVVEVYQVLWDTINVS